MHALRRALSTAPVPATAAAGGKALAVPVWAKVPSAAMAAARGLKGACGGERRPHAPAPAAPVQPARRAPSPAHPSPPSARPSLPCAVTPHWARYNVSASAGALPVSEARRLPALAAAGADGGSGWAGRRAVIDRASRAAMTSGQSAAGSWRLRASHASKWGNPLMGWLSSADTAAPAARMHARFESAEQAVLWCERNGVAYELAPAAAAAAAGAGAPVDNQYAYNFLPRDVVARMKRLGARGARAIFANARACEPAIVTARTTPFGAEAWAPSSASRQTAAAWTGPAWPAKVPLAPAHQVPPPPRAD